MRATIVLLDPGQPSDAVGVEDEVRELDVEVVVVVVAGASMTRVLELELLDVKLLDAELIELEPLEPKLLEVELLERLLVKGPVYVPVLVEDEDELKMLDAVDELELELG